MTAYYVKRRGELAGPYPTRTAAMDVAAYMVGRIANPKDEDYPRILLDESSVGALSDRETKMLLWHDPLLSHIFKVGYAYGREAVEREAATR